MNWVVLLSVLFAWLLVGFAVAYAFGRFARGAEGPDNAGDLTPAVVRYLRRNKRAKTGSNSSVPAQARHSQAQPKKRRASATRH